MIKLVTVFVSLFVILFFGIDMFRKFTKREKWQVAKIAGFSALISLFAVLIMAGMVVLF